MNFLVTALGNFLIGLFKGWLGERSRDKANQVAGEVVTENKIIQAAGERAKDANETLTELSSLDDDALFERMRNNRNKRDSGSQD